ncbi:MAG: hypothetical protein ABFD50_08405 [Smithella sp.]
MKFVETKLTNEEYEKLVADTFGEYMPHVQHNIIVCKDGENIVGVFNYFRYGLDVMFLHRSWYSKEYQRKIRKVQYWLSFCDYAKGQGYKSIMGVINSENIPALIWALKTGFKISGIRQAQDNSLIIDITRAL